MGPGISLAEKTWHFAWITGLTAILNIGLNFLLVPRFGIIGAGIATLISFIVYWQIKVRVAAKYFPLSYPFFRIMLFFFFGLGLSLSVAFWPDSAGWGIRFLALGIITATAFLLKLLKWHEVISIVENIKSHRR